MITSVLWYILVGAVVGIVARLVVPGRNPIGVLLTLLVGVAGAILGGVLATALGAGEVVAFILAVVIAAVAVAVLTGAQGGGWSAWRGPRRRSRVM